MVAPVSGDSGGPWLPVAAAVRQAGGCGCTVAAKIWGFLQCRSAEISWRARSMPRDPIDGHRSCHARSVCADQAWAMRDGTPFYLLKYLKEFLWLTGNELSWFQTISTNQSRRYNAGNLLPWSVFSSLFSCDDNGVRSGFHTSVHDAIVGFSTIPWNFKFFSRSGPWI